MISGKKLAAPSLQDPGECPFFILLGLNEKMPHHLLMVTILSQASPSRGVISKIKTREEAEAKDQEEATKCNHLNPLRHEIIF